MASTSTLQRRPAPAGRRLVRFDRVERFAHWANALLFGILMATALPLYFVQIDQFIGRRTLLQEIHLWAGLMLPVPLFVSLAGPWGKRLRRDLRGFSLWTQAERRWLWSFGKKRLSEPDKFNPGQKLNALFVAGAIVVMLGSGAILKWFSPFPLVWRTGATFVHDLLALAIFLVVAGHIVMAITHREALRSIFRGWVSESWAKRHASGWLKEETSALASGGTGTPAQGEP